MNDVMDIQEILKYLPQRYPFLMIDKVISIVPGKSIIALKNVSVNEPYFLGHFPNNPIMPGVLILEAMAQATGILALHADAMRGQTDYLYLFAGIDKVRFKRSVIPGDQLKIEAVVQWTKREIWKSKVTSKVGADLICSAELMGARRKIKND